LSAPIVLYRASDQMLSHYALDATLGWRDLAENDIQVRIVPGNHGSITGKPFVRELAQKLCDDLDAAQRVPSRHCAAAKSNTELTPV
jgi:thioesterase domain-containing protein